VNILLVDDDVNVLESLQFGVAYSSLGIEKIYVAENAADAKKILKNVPIHIMVTDIEMPNESGIELLKWTKTQNLLYSARVMQILIMPKRLWNFNVLTII